MKELSLHILDIVMNSVKAQSSLIEVDIEDSIEKNLLKIVIRDNGRGIDEETLKNVTNPFFTTRTTRKVGLGLPLLKEACERCGGYFKIDSKAGKGTVVESSFERNNIDRAPLGNMGETVIAVINSLDGSEFVYNHKTDKGIFQMSTIQIKEILDGADINDINVILWLRDYVNENIMELYEG